MWISREREGPWPNGSSERTSWGELFLLVSILATLGMQLPSLTKRIISSSNHRKCGKNREMWIISCMKSQEVCRFTSLEGWDCRQVILNSVGYLELSFLF